MSGGYSITVLAASSRPLQLRRGCRVLGQRWNLRTRRTEAFACLPASVVLIAADPWGAVPDQRSAEPTALAAPEAAPRRWPRAGQFRSEEDGTAGRG